MTDKPQYMPHVELREVMRGLVLGVFEESKNPNFQTGHMVSGVLGWQDYALISTLKTSVPSQDYLTLYQHP
jgi:NADPH-dependent curcumin reductase CurA